MDELYIKKSIALLPEKRTEIERVYERMKDNDPWYVVKRAWSNEIFLLKNGGYFLLAYACMMCNLEIVEFIFTRLMELNGRKLHGPAVVEHFVSSSIKTFDFIVSKIKDRYKKMLIHKALNQINDGHYHYFAMHVLKKYEVNISEVATKAIRMGYVDILAEMKRQKPNANWDAHLRENLPWFAITGNHWQFADVLIIIKPREETLEKCYYNIYRMTDIRKEVKEIILRYIRDKDTTIRELRKERGFATPAAELFALVIFACDNFLEIR